MGKEVEQDKEKAYEYFRLAAEQGNVCAAYFLEHWNDMTHPDLLLMATRLMHHLEKIIEEDASGKKGGRRAGMDRKLARKIRQRRRYRMSVLPCIREPMDCWEKMEPEKVRLCV